ncbi:MAG TPA: D-alanyl-D-alanine carboxypeptidase family protein [Candidatus Binataceae bacterium]|nr:D-alanyl-D-alanine carboxypeptidase family protein [Candidatus Binataceae bacterium]
MEAGKLAKIAEIGGGDETAASGQLDNNPSSAHGAPASKSSQALAISHGTIGAVERRWFLRTALWLSATAATELIAGPALAAMHHRRASRASHDAENSAAATNSNGLTDPYTTACVMEPTTRTVIFDKDMNRPWPTASLAKMMVMLIVAEKLADGSLKLDDKVTTSAAASRMGGSQVYLAEGETFTLDDMMKAVVVHSANDATYAVTEYVAGSADAFVTLMNERAETLGLRNTHFYSVHGLPPAPGQGEDVASAYDLAIIGSELVKYPNVLRWSSIDTAPFRNGKFILRNTNHLVRTFPGCDGLKTGFYDKAGFNVVATAHREGMRLIAVVLGSPRKEENFASAATLMAQGFLHYEMRALAKQGAPAGRTLAVKDGALSTITPVWGADASMLAPRDDSKLAISIDYKLPPRITAPIKAGTQVGSAQIIVDGKPQQVIALVAPKDVGQAAWYWRVIDRWY